MEVSDEVVDELLETFIQFKKIHWRPHNKGALKPNEGYLLFMIQNNQDESGVKVSDLSAKLNVTSPTITQQINSLEAGGYVERTMDKFDRRAVRIKLTEKGENEINLANEHLYIEIRKLAVHLGPEDCTALTRIFKKMFTFYVNKNP
jgi:DNA-binding MarR family transcriptional regulator